ncbi:MAG TPA: hypothetical protein VFY54_08035, partial [Rubrobacter sp.]|nr:hypothetical protein [Rubrobacter sp.]
MLTRESLRTGRATLPAATAVALLAALTLLLTLYAHRVEAQVSLLTKDKTGAQASADIKFADFSPPQSGSSVFHVDPNGADDISGNADDGSDTSNPGTRDRP